MFRFFSPNQLPVGRAEEGKGFRAAAGSLPMVMSQLIVWADVGNQYKLLLRQGTDASSCMPCVRAVGDRRWRCGGCG